MIWTSKDETATELLPSDLKQPIEEYKRAHGDFQPTQQRQRILTNRNFVSVFGDLNNHDVTGGMEHKMELIKSWHSMKWQCERESQVNAKMSKSTIVLTDLSWLIYVDRIF